jgi:hypothetical protein
MVGGMAELKAMRAVMEALRSIADGVDDPQRVAQQALRAFVAVVDEHTPPSTVGVGRPDRPTARPARCRRRRCSGRCRP